MPIEDRSYWNHRFQQEGWHTEPSTFLVSLEAVLPRNGKALDVAGGPGRNALWLAERGIEVTLLDISNIALNMARQTAEDRGLALDLIEADLAEDPIPTGPWDVIICFNYLHRPLLPTLGSVLARDGLLVLELATRTNLERHKRPPPEFLLERAEIITLLPGLELLEYHERWWDDRHVAQVVAKPTVD